MDFRPTADQKQLVESFASLYAKQATSTLVRAAEPDGFDADMWDALTQVGAVGMALPESLGGGASLLDLALVAREHGRYAAPAPLVEAQVGARLAARLGERTAELSAAVAADGRLVTTTVRRACSGTAELVPAAAVADFGLVLLDSDLRCVELDGRRRPVRTGCAAPVADITESDSAPVVASGAEAVAAWENAVDEWMTLTAEVLVGLGQRALEMAVDYVKVRTAFGRVIGSFQGVAHPLADAATALDGAMLLADEAAWSTDQDAERFPELAAMAFAFATEAARHATATSVHVLGGYGVSLEYDAQLYFRRAQGWPALLAEPRIVKQWVYERRMRRLGL